MHRYVHLAWAMWERKQGNRQQCIELLRRGQAMNPTDAAIYQAWAIVEQEAGSIERARQLFEAGLRADPGHMHIWQAWGVMEAGMGNVDRARQLFQEGVWADPRSKDTVFVFHAWGLLEKRQGKHQLARELFKAAIKVGGGMFLAGQIYLSLYGGSCEEEHACMFVYACGLGRRFERVGDMVGWSLRWPMVFVLLTLVCGVV